MKYFIKTFGCQMNVSDSERIASFLESQGLTPVTSFDQADLTIFNTCGVRQTAEDRVYGQIHNIRKQPPRNIDKRPIIILTGCLANRPDVQKKLQAKVDLFCEIKNFPQAVLPFLANSSHSQTKPKFSSYLTITPKYSQLDNAYVPIMTGCNNFCSYCVVPYARGREFSRSFKEIFFEIKKLATKKYLSVTLLGQNVNSYLYQIPTNYLPSSDLPIKNLPSKITFPFLLNFLAQTFPKIIFHFLTSHPKDFSTDLIKVIATNKNISREIHLPVQSGSDKILKAMNRPYTKKHYLSIIQKIKKAIPETTFTTDVIVGFPGETEKDFQDTVKIFRKVGYNEAYINKYSPRPGTAAHSLGDPIAWSEKKRRANILRQLIKT